MGLSCGWPKPECHHISRDLPNPMVTASFEDKHFILLYHILCVQCTRIHKLGWGAECPYVWKSGSGCFPLWLPTLSFEISHWILRSLTDLTGWPAISGGVCLSPPSPVWMLLIHMTTPSCFTWVLGMQTRVPIFTRQALYLLNHLPSPQNDTYSVLLEVTEIYVETFYHFSPISLSHPKKFWLLVKRIFKDPFQNNWSRLLANAAFISMSESIVILTKDCFLSIILHCTQMECLGWGTSGTRVSFFHRVICSQSRQQVREHCFPEVRKTCLSTHGSPERTVNVSLPAALR